MSRSKLVLDFGTDADMTSTSESLSKSAAYTDRAPSAVVVMIILVVESYHAMVSSFAEACADINGAPGELIK